MKTAKILFAIALIAQNVAVLGQTTYPATWTDLTNLTVTAGNTLTKTGGTAGWDGAAVSVNMLPASTDGSIQFTYSTTVNNYMVSLSRFNKNSNYSYNDYTIYVVGSSNALQIYEASTNRGSFGALANGDVLKIAREGLTIKYYKNGVVIHTTTLTAMAALSYLRADVSVLQVGTVVPSVTCSFDRVVNMRPQMTFPTLANNDGAITLNPEGGDAPYTYIWSSSETSAGISGKARGNYSVTVSDASGRTASATYYLGYPVTWTNLEGANVNADGSFTRTLAGVGWTAGASSLNRIPPSTDGFIEFTVTDATAVFLIGLSDYDPDASYVSVDFGISVDQYGTLYNYAAGSATALGSVQKGDVFRVGREGNQWKAYRNGVLVRTLPGVLINPLYADVSIYSNEGPTPVVTISADKQIRLKPTVNLPTAANNDGSIALTTQGAYNPISTLWSPGGETSNLITSKSRGTYSVSVTDGESRAVNRTYRMGYPVLWTDLQNCQVNSDNSVSQTVTGGGSWSAGATSGNVLPANTDGWLEFVIGRSRVTGMVGLSRINSSPGYTSIDNAFYLLGGNFLYIYELGAQKAVLNYVEEGDVIAIAREGSNIKYYINGVAVRTVATVASYELVIDLSLSAVVGLPTPILVTSFNRTPQTYYTIASGNWTTPSIWSLAEGGPPATLYPVSGDLVFIKGVTVAVGSAVSASNITINVNTDNTLLKVDGSQAALTVKGSINVSGLSNANTTKALQVINDAKLSVLNP